MAPQRKTATSKNNPKSKTSSSRKKSSSNSSKQKKEDIVEVGFGDYWHAFTKTKVFVPIMTVVISVLLVGLDLLISWNDFSRFFLFLGIEIIAAAVVWLIMTIYSFGSEKKNSDEEV
ncbi:MAG: hypothetical protein IKE53_04210 [Clostridiales bacterium]|nr:hypothetical protein [Clostridiales bacterium]